MRATTGLLLAAIMAVGCGSKMPGGGSVPGADKVPGGGNVPGGLGGASGEVDPNTCGNYAVSDAGRKLHDFLEATKQVQEVSMKTVQVVKESCLMMGHELGLVDDDMKGETKDICAKVYGTIHDNMKVAFKAKAGLKIKYKPAVCKVNIDAEAEAAAKCEGKASADMGATCSGACHGKCDGQCSGKAGTGGNSGECNGECKGTCHGSCEGHADVKASGQCKASAQVHASADVQCTEAELTIEPDMKLVVDKSKAEKTVAALKAGLPKILSVKARLEPLQAAVETWAASAKELKEMGPKFVNSFKDQAMCITGQIAAVASAVTNIHASLSVSVSVSASASGTIGGK